MERNPTLSNLVKFEQKYPQKLRMSGPENHSGPSRTIQISMPGVFLTKMLLIKLKKTFQFVSTG